MIRTWIWSPPNGTHGPHPSGFTQFCTIPTIGVLSCRQTLALLTSWFAKIKTTARWQCLSQIFPVNCLLTLIFSFSQIVSYIVSGMTIQSNFESTLFNSSINLIVFEGTLHVRLYHSKEIIKEFFLQSNTGLEIPQTSREVFIKTISDKPSYFGLLYPKLQTEENRAPKTNNSSDNKTRSFAEEVRARNHWIAR